MIEGSIWLLKVTFGNCIFLSFSTLRLFDQFHKEIVNTEYFTLISCLKILCRIQKSSQVCVLSKHISKLKMLIAFDWGLYLICECYFWRLHFPIFLKRIFIRKKNQLFSVNSQPICKNWVEMVMQNTLQFRIMHYLKILVRKHLLIPYGLNELKYKKIPKDKTPLNSLRGVGEWEVGSNP